MLLYENKQIGDFYYLLIFLKKRNSVNKMPPDFFEFVGDIIAKNKELNFLMRQSMCERYERALIANYHHLQYLKLKSHYQSKYNDWNTTYFEVFEMCKKLKHEEQRKQIALDRELRRMARKKTLR